MPKHKRTYTRANTKRQATPNVIQRAIDYYLAGETARQIAKRVRCSVATVNSWTADWRKRTEREAVELLEQGGATFNAISAVTGAPVWMIVHWNQNRHRRKKGLSPLPLKRRSKKPAPPPETDGKSVPCLVCGQDAVVCGDCAHCEHCGTSTGNLLYGRRRSSLPSSRDGIVRVQNRQLIREFANV